MMLIVTRYHREGVNKTMENQRRLFVDKSSDYYKKFNFRKPKKNLQP